jgi:hypothetical protein
MYVFKQDMNNTATDLNRRKICLDRIHGQIVLKNVQSLTTMPLPKTRNRKLR